MSYNSTTTYLEDYNLLKNTNDKESIVTDDNLVSTNVSGSCISTAAGNTWPYTGTNTGNYTWTTNGTGGYNLGTSINVSSTWDTSHPGLKVNGDADFEGDIKFKGKSLSKTLEKIEERLGILYPNEKLENKWEELRELRNRYVELEKQLLEKEKMWDILKK